MLLEELLKKEKLENYLEKKIKEGLTLEESIIDTCIYYGKTPKEVIKVIYESAPSCPEAEDFIKNAKEDFKKRYGKKWKQVLYATAWSIFGKRKDCRRKKK